MSATAQAPVPRPAQPASRSVAKRTLIDRLNSPAQMAEIARALPKHLTSDRMARVFMTALSKTPKLAECTPESFFLAVMTCSQLGIEPDGWSAHLIPFENRGKKTTECQLIIGYRGLVSLVMQSGLYSSIHADVVRENDEFEYDRGLLVRHRINFREPRGEAYAAYAIARSKDGGETCMVLSKPEILDIRDGSQGWQAFTKGFSKSNPWDPANEGSEKEMWKKTAARRLCKWLKISPEIHEAMDREDRGKVEVNSSLVTDFGAIEVSSHVKAPAQVAPPGTDPEPADEPGGDPAPLSEGAIKVATLLNEAAVPFKLFAGWLKHTGFADEEPFSFSDLPESVIDELLANNGAVLKKCITINAPPK